MPAYNVSVDPPLLFKAEAKHRQVTVKSGNKEELAAAKKKATDQGGKITNEFSIIPGFTYVLYSLPSPAENHICLLSHCSIILHFHLPLADPL